MATIRVGDNFKLKTSGITVTVKEYVSAQHILVSDGKGGEKITTAVQLRNGNVGWRDVETIKSNYLNVSKYYVYAVEYKGEIIYIGKGTGSRYSHVTSGASHIYEFNRLHFSGEKVNVSLIANGILQDKASEIEKEKIVALKPKLNKVFN